jgi:anti-anti-sigma factor
MAVDQSELLGVFRCEVVPDRETVVVRPVGELDLATVPVVDAQLADLWSVGFTRLVLDLRGVGFLDSTGLRMLVAWQTHGSIDGLVFGVIPGPPAVARALDIAGIADHLTYWTADGKGPRRAMPDA